MKNWMKILIFLIDNKGLEFTVKSISEKLGINYMIVHKAIKELHEKGAINIKKVAGANLCSFNYSLNMFAVQAEDERKTSILKKKNLGLIYARLKEIQNPFYILLLFGSYAKHRETKNSDIDLCIITDSEFVKKKARSIIEQIPLNIHLLDFSKDEFLSMLTTRKQNLGHEIVRDNIILKGTDEFYELVNYAEQ